MGDSDETRFLRTKPRQARSEETVARLLDAAGETFGEVGVGAATTTEIARRADVAVGSMYHFFPSKVEMALALANQCVDELVGRLRTVAAEFEDLDQLTPFARKMVEATQDVFQSHPGYFAALSFCAGIDGDSPLTELHAAVTEILTGLFAKAGFSDTTSENSRRTAMFTIEIVRLMLEHAPDDEPEFGSYIDELIRVIVAYLLSFASDQGQPT